MCLVCQCSGMGELECELDGGAVDQKENVGRSRVSATIVPLCFVCLVKIYIYIYKKEIFLCVILLIGV